MSLRTSRTAAAKSGAATQTAVAVANRSHCSPCRSPVNSDSMVVTRSTQPAGYSTVITHTVISVNVAASLETT